MAEKMYLSQLLRLRDCEKKYHFHSLSLKGESEQRLYEIKRQTLALMKQSIGKKKEGEVINEVTEFLKQGYTLDMFPIGISRDLSLAKQIGIFKRMITYIYALDITVEGVDVPYSISFPEREIGEHTLDGVYGVADLVINQHDKIIAIMFDLNEQRYSFRARKPINMVENSIELMSMKIGLESRYPGVVPALYCLKGKDDKPTELPAFDYKQGKNIVQYNFLEPEKELMGRYLKALEYKDDAGCEECLSKNLCIFQVSPRKTEPEAGDTEIVEKPAKQKRYTEAQKEVVQHFEGPANVIAVPGAGKTYSLVERLRFLIDEKNVKPQKILFVTFTNKACEEIEDRVKKALCVKDGDEMPEITTFNSLGYKILRDNPSLLGKRVRLAGVVDRLIIIREVLSHVPKIHSVSYDGLYMKHGLIRRLDEEFDNISKNGIDVWKEKTKFADVHGVEAAYHKYIEIFQNKGLVTYDMQISCCIELLKKYPRLAELYSKQWKYIMVDEFQDVSAENAELIYLIGKHHGNLLVVGDDDQSIYQFRGGSNAFMLNFKEDFPNAKTIIMNDNFRSSDKILSVSAALIENNMNRYKKEFVAHDVQPFEPILCRNFSKEKLPGIIKSLTQKYALNQIAILARYNKVLYGLSDYLSMFFPTSSPKNYLINDAVFQGIADILALFYSNGAYDSGFYRFLVRNGCKEEIERMDKDKFLLEDICNQYGVLCEGSNIRNRAAGNVNMEKALAKLFDCFGALKTGNSVRAILNKVSELLYGVTEHAALDELEKIAEDRGIVSMSQLSSFLQDMIRFSDEKRIVYTDTESLQLMTAHDSKGKEFPVVIVYGTEDFGTDEAERCLLYVALTRAQRTLIVTESSFSHSELLDECAGKMRAYGG